MFLIELRLRTRKLGRCSTEISHALKAMGYQSLPAKFTERDESNMELYI